MVLTKTIVVLLVHLFEPVIVLIDRNGAGIVNILLRSSAETTDVQNAYSCVQDLVSSLSKEFQGRLSALTCSSTGNIKGQRTRRRQNTSADNEPVMVCIAEGQNSIMMYNAL
jgi:hypothetical protein